MPTYTYQCDTCGEYFEQNRNVKERHMPQKCECGGELKKQFTAPSRVWGPTRNK